MQSLAKELIDLLISKNLTLSVAESCTGGLICSYITDVSGASTVFDRGFITYSNQAKTELLGVNKKTLEKFGAVSAETAIEMARGVLQHSQSDISVSITGIAGPTGGSETKPVGLVYIGLMYKKHEPKAHEHYFKGNREDIRNLGVKNAFTHLIKYLDTMI
jgi:PncC family amidohydrolase